MKILIVSATPFEITPLLRHLDEGGFRRDSAQLYRKGAHEVHLLVTGPGIALTAYSLTKAFSKNAFDLTINAGIAGSYRRDLALGDVVQVVSEQFGDLGVEEADGSFTDLFALGLLDPGEWPFRNGVLEQSREEPFPGWPVVSGLTVHKVNGYPPSIEASLKKYRADVETMEGAAFFLVCLMEQQPFLALRAISNYVEARNREAWEISKAIDHLNKTLIDMLETILA